MRMVNTFGSEYHVFIIDPITWKEKEVLKTRSFLKARRVCDSYIKRGIDASVKKKTIYAPVFFK